MKQIILKAKEIRCLYGTGKITREQALAQLKPYIDLVNEKSIKLAKKFGVKPKLVTLETYLR